MIKPIIIAWLLMTAPSASDNDLQNNYQMVSVYHGGGDDCELMAYNLNGLIQTDRYFWCWPQFDCDEQ